VPYEAFLKTDVAKNARVKFATPEHGGHCGFISRWQGTERFWAEERVVEFVRARTEEK